MTGPGALSAADVASMEPSLGARLVAYLNLPPVGAFADASGPPTPGTEAAFELPGSLRGTLVDRRRDLGRFSSPGDLVGIPGFDRSALDAVLAELPPIGRAGHRVKPVWGGAEALRELFALLESATRYIHISTYILGGHVGLRLAELLARKQRDGVRVRLLFCATGLVTSGAPSGTGRPWHLNDHYARQRVLRVLGREGVPFLNTAPVARHWHRRALRALGVTTARAYERWAGAEGLPDDWIAEQESLDRDCQVAFAHVDHRKMAIVDGERAFVGGQNLADNYLYENALSPDWRVNVRRWQWHDHSAIVEGGCAATMNALFARRWRLSGGDAFDQDDRFYAPPARLVGDALVTAVASVPGGLRLPLRRNLPRILATAVGADRRPVSEGCNPIRDRLRSLPRLATREFLAEHCYPTDAQLLDEWKRAAGGVPAFRLILPVHYDSLLIGYECRRFVPELIDAGIDVRGFEQAILHGKVAVVDGWYVTIGSYNLNLRSARGDLELQFFIQSPEYGAAVCERLRGDLELCRREVPTALARLRGRCSVPIFDALLRHGFL